MDLNALTHLSPGSLVRMFHSVRESRHLAQTGERRPVPFQKTPTFSPGKLYRKLKKNEIRVVVIHYENDCLYGTLRTVPLPGEGRRILYRTIHNHVQQELWVWKRWAALSYVWGDPTPVKDFILDGHRIKIHLNLYQALRQFAQKPWGYPIWTDYICINQADEQERTRHIRMMDRIYAHAYVVYSYLGESNQFTQSAVDFLAKMHPVIQSRVDEFVEEARSSGQTTWVGNAPWMRAAMPPQDEQDGIAQEIFAILHNDYFFRSWVLQEIVLARTHNMQRGSVEIDVTILHDYFCHFSWRISILSAFFNSLPQLKDYQLDRFINPWPFARAVCSTNLVENEEERSSSNDAWPERRSAFQRRVSRLLDTNSWVAAKCAERFRGPDHIWYAEDLDNPSYEVLGNLLNFSFELGCTRPEDRCLSLMGLIRWGARRKMAQGRWSHLLEKLPKALDARSVFVNFAITMLQGRNGMLVLSWAAYSRCQADYDLPSWCPNFHRMAGFRFSSPLSSLGGREIHTLALIEQDEKPIVSYNQVHSVLSSYGISIDTVTRCMAQTWKEAGGDGLASIDTEQEFDLDDITTQVAINFLEAVWQYFQQAVRASPRVKQSYRDKIERCSIQEAGISFASCLVVPAPDDLENFTDTDIQSLLKYLQKLMFISDQTQAKHGERSEAHDSSPPIPTPEADVERIIGNISGHYFFVTENGYFGSGTAPVRPGDRLVILAGAQNPFIIRPVTPTISHTEIVPRWQLIAETHVLELTTQGTFIHELDPPSLWPTTLRADHVDVEVEVGVEAKSDITDDEMSHMRLRWRANKPFEPTSMRIEGHDYLVPPIEGKPETFELV